MNPVNHVNKVNLVNPVNSANHANSVTNNCEVLYDAAVPLARAAASLPSGITASLEVLGTKIVIAYRVRIMVRGKRQSIGPFYNVRQALDARFQVKNGAARSTPFAATQTATSAQAAAQASYPMERQEFNLNFSPSSPSSINNLSSANPNSANTVSFPTSNFIQPAQSEASLLAALQEMDDVIFAAGLAPHELTGDSMLTVQLPDGKEFYISAAMQREYNAWFVAGMPRDWELTRSDSGNNLKPKEQAQSEQNAQSAQQSEEQAAAGASALSLDDL